jgi:hypothetical protein
MVDIVRFRHLAQFPMYDRSAKKETLELAQHP